MLFGDTFIFAEMKTQVNFRLRMLNTEFFKAWLCSEIGADRTPSVTKFNQCSKGD
ncbi:hypothetical protein [Rhizobium leguminosarum]|jgi:hypothetical protein|uniref:hypothetical protein n=1 Tax=Rhizobium leguminosarum TaxID=384 RepID=UPI0004B79CC5|nr:hypothetical protein [Rhizobium leguminosarum]